VQPRTLHFSSGGHARGHRHASRALAERLGFRLHRTDTTPSAAPVNVYERIASPTPVG
jgi:hypothetical protein